jgi:hypothetical protein
MNLRINSGYFQNIRLAFVTGKQGAFCDVGTGVLNIIQINFRLKALRPFRSP